jgi:ABC-type multidrug transport system fused ATPase/permease subunit
LDILQIVFLIIILSHIFSKSPKARDSKSMIKIFYTKIIKLKAHNCGVSIFFRSSQEIGYEKVRENVGFVLQLPLMFNNSLRFNLTLGKVYADDRIYEALKVAQLYEFVDGLEEKLDTIVGKNGTKLSGGQKQRLSIARVLLDNPKVIIFDESTSSVHKYL